MKEYPVGSVCVVVDDKICKGSRIGLECTIVEPLREKWLTDGYYDAYLVELQGGQQCNACHPCLKLKKFPGQLHSWLTEKMDKLLAPNVDITVDLIRERGAV